MSELTVKVVSGAASADEVAAIVAVLSAIAKSTPAEAARIKSNWSNPALLHRKPLPTTWTTSFSS